MEPNPQYIAFVNAMTQVLAQRESANVMIVIESEDGVEVHTSFPSLLWAFGALKAANELITSGYLRDLEEASIQKKEKEIEAEFQAAVQAAKGSVN